MDFSVCVYNIYIYIIFEDRFAPIVAKVKGEPFVLGLNTLFYKANQFLRFDRVNQAREAAA